jgi:hypothetical protein
MRRSLFRPRAPIHGLGVRSSFTKKAQTGCEGRGCTFETLYLRSRQLASVPCLGSSVNENSPVHSPSIQVWHSTRGHSAVRPVSMRLLRFSFGEVAFRKRILSRHT